MTMKNVTGFAAEIGIASPHLSDVGGYNTEKAAPVIGAAFWCLPGGRGVWDRRIIYAHRRRYPEVL
jgi:hypothetical protein